MSTMPVRIMVEDAWDEVTLDLPASTPVHDAKRRALALTHRMGDVSGYVIKFRGAELFDEGRSLADHGVVANAALIVLPRRRRPVR
ncbi:MAG: hypothetical protein IPJ95_14010 [Gemmatimonadetes bacterium]|nr:hypothetical protein [Gemmatimonadota bacterium]MBK9690580.1 hypothetical protein [Gemmatimonadota bacterium]